jgi:hypothetical protein
MKRPKRKAAKRELIAPRGDERYILRDTKGRSRLPGVPSFEDPISRFHCATPARLCAAYTMRSARSAAAMPVRWAPCAVA